MRVAARILLGAAAAFAGVQLLLLPALVVAIPDMEPVPGAWSENPAAAIAFAVLAVAGVAGVVLPLSLCCMPRPPTAVAWGCVGLAALYPALVLLARFDNADVAPLPAWLVFIATYLALFAAALGSVVSTALVGVPSQSADAVVAGVYATCVLLGTALSLRSVRPPPGAQPGA